MTVKYARSTGFQKALKGRVGEYFRNRGLPQRDLPQMYIKTAVILSWCAVSYWLLVFQARAWYQALPLCLSLALAVAGIGFNIQHDGSHGAYSNSKAINSLMATTLDLIGGSSYLWRIKHNLIHHHSPNIIGVDTDIDIGPLGYLPPDRPLNGIHRFQFLYLWLLYGFLAAKWQFFDDFRDLIRGRIGSCRVSPPGRWELARLLVGKALAFCLMFVIPGAKHAWWMVGVFYGVTSFVLDV